MKKHIYLFAVLAALLLASCKNEDIDISREVVFEVNPYSVVKDFAQHELHPGELSSIYWYSLGDRLRVQLFVYDDKGNLVKSKVDYLNDYTSTMTASFELPDGAYNAIVITDEVGISGSQVTDEYWFITGTDRLTNLKIASNNEWSEFGEFKKLGISQKAFMVNAGNTAFCIDVTPAGAMMQSWIYNIHGFTDILNYSLWINKQNGSYSFNNSGLYEVGYDQTNFSLRIRNTNPADYDAGNIYAYHFLSPFEETGFHWIVLLDDGEYYYFMDDEYINIKAGKSYTCILDIDGLNSTFKINELGHGKDVMPSGPCYRRYFKDKNDCKVEYAKPIVVNKSKR